MRQFGTLPVYVNYNVFTDEERAASSKKHDKLFDAAVASNPKLRREIEAERKEAIEKYNGYSDYRRDIAIHAGQTADKFRDQVTKGPSTAEGEAWEDQVLKLLRTIQTTDIGRLLYRFLDCGVKVWILPTVGEEGGPCDCVAATTPGVLEANKGGGVRVYYNPIPGESKDRYYSSDDVLFHELVHAYRAAVLKSPTRHRNSPLADYKSEEEFLAVYITNIYRANRGDINFYRAHTDSTLLRKGDSYRYLTKDDEAFDALSYFVANDALARAVAKWSHPDFNPWRDYGQIKKQRAKNQAMKKKLIDI